MPPGSFKAIESPSKAPREGFFARLPREDPRAFRSNLWYKFFLINIGWAIFMAAAYMQGWIDIIIATDTTYFVRGIMCIFVAALISSAWKTREVSKELNVVKEYLQRGASALAKHPLSRMAIHIGNIKKARSATGVEEDAKESRSLFASLLGTKMAARLNFISDYGNILVMLGLLGTVLGFIIALGGVNPDTVADTAGIRPMVAQLVSGMSLALYTTLVGGWLYIWHLMNSRIVKTGSALLYTAIVEAAELKAAESKDE